MPGRLAHPRGDLHAVAEGPARGWPVPTSAVQAPEEPARQEGRRPLPRLLEDLEGVQRRLERLLLEGDALLRVALHRGPLEEQVGSLGGGVARGGAIRRPRALELERAEVLEEARAERRPVVDPLAAGAGQLRAELLEAREPLAPAHALLPGHRLEVTRRRAGIRAAVALLELRAEALEGRQLRVVPLTEREEGGVEARQEGALVLAGSVHGAVVPGARCSPVRRLERRGVRRTGSGRSPRIQARGQGRGDDEEERDRQVGRSRAVSRLPPHRAGWERR